MCFRDEGLFTVCRNVVRLAFLSKRAALHSREPELRDEIMTGDAHSLDTACAPSHSLLTAGEIPDLLDYGW